jgi:hypothetical protein
MPTTNIAARASTVTASGFRRGLLRINALAKKRSPKLRAGFAERCSLKIGEIEIKGGPRVALIPWMIKKVGNAVNDV